MSYDATNWAFKQRGLKPATKIVLFYLCDRFHPDNGCFPSQDTLSADCEMSRSSLNDHLDILEKAGLIAREQRRRRGSMQQDRTHYRFAFEPGFTPVSSQEPCPNSGHGDDEKAVSEKQPEPCPKNAESRVRNSDSNPVREPVKESVNERECAQGEAEEKQEADGSESREAIERAFMRFFPKWPTYVSDSQTAARKAWFSLTASERIEAVERISDYLAADKAAGRKYHCSAGAYLTEKRWQNLPAPVKEQDRPKVAKPFGKAWSALRLSELLKPMAPMPPLTATLRMVINQGGEAADRIKLERRWRYGWPLASRMHDLAKEFTGVMVSADLVAAGQGFQQVKRGGDLEAAWKRLHERNGWPWLPDAGDFEWVYFPAIADSANDYDAAVEAALMDFKARIEDHAHVAAE